MANNQEANLRSALERVTQITELWKLGSDDERKALIKEFADNAYLKSCDFEPHVDTLLFCLLNYALTLPDLISGDLVRMFGDLFSHAEHCHSIAKHNEHSCKISLKLFRSNWLKVYFESMAKIHSYSFQKMNDHLIDLMYVLFKKSPNRETINCEFVTALNALIYSTTAELGKKEKAGQKPVPCEKKRKVVLLLILILDGQFQLLVDKKTQKNVADLLDKNGIRMYWQNLDQTENAKGRVEDIVKFCRTLIEMHQDVRNEIEID